MRTYPRGQLERFLTAVDAHLPGRSQMIVIGGTAAALHYGVTRATHDIDTWTNVGIELSRAAALARSETGLDIPIERSTVADAPDGFEARLERALPQLSHLVVLVPEKHDLVLMKAIRAYEHDLDAVAEIHRYAPLTLDTLVARFQDEMSPIGDPGRIRDNFLLVVERLFPDDVDRIELLLKRRGR